MNGFAFCPCMVLAAVPTPRRGDDAKTGDAVIEKVVADGLAAGRKADWKEYAGLVHPDSLRQYKDMWLPLLRTATRERPDKQAELLAAFDKAADLKAVMALEPGVFFVSSMKGMESQLPALKGNPVGAEEKIIGTVRDGDDQAYVVVRIRTKFGQTDLTKVEVVELRRSGAAWKMMLPDVVRIMAESFDWRQKVGRAGPVTDHADPDK